MEPAIYSDHVEDSTYITLDTILFHMHFYYGAFEKGPTEVHKGPYTIRFQASDTTLRYTELIVDHVDIESSLGRHYLVPNVPPISMLMTSRNDSPVWDLGRKTLVNVPYHYADAVIGGPYAFNPSAHEVVSISVQLRALGKDGVKVYSLKAVFDPVIREGRFQAID